MDKASTGSLESFYKEVGNNVKRHRVRKKMTLEDLGFAVGLDRMNISRIEKGLNITLATILKLSLALNVKPHVLLKVNSANQVFELDALVSQNKASKIKEKPISFGMIGYQFYYSGELCDLFPIHTKKFDWNDGGYTKAPDQANPTLTFDLRSDRVSLHLQFLR
jgi:transcriptional regulator with XRE-family HTH domain